MCRPQWTTNLETFFRMAGVGLADNRDMLIHGVAFAILISKQIDQQVVG